MRNLVANALELHDIVLAILRQPKAKHIAPVDVNEQQAQGNIERVGKSGIVTRYRQVAFLVVVELVEHTDLPKIIAVCLGKLAHHIRIKGLEQKVKALIEKIAVISVVLHGLSPWDLIEKRVLHGTLGSKLRSL